jgi:hypothetical protein
MTGYAHQYAELAPDSAVMQRESVRPHHQRTHGKVRVSTKPRALSPEDEQILEAVNTTRRELDQLHNRYDNISDEILIESLIYEIKAAHMKYQYYLNLCKDKGIVCRI